MSSRGHCRLYDTLICYYLINTMQVSCAYKTIIHSSPLTSQLDVRYFTSTLPAHESSSLLLVALTTAGGDGLNDADSIWRYAAKETRA